MSKQEPQSECIKDLNSKGLKELDNILKKAQKDREWQARGEKSARMFIFS